MSKPRRLKAYEKELDETLDLEQLAATAGDAYNIYAMNTDTAVPNCPLCKQRMKNHGKYERQYLDVISSNIEKPKFITLHYLFYKYRCLNEDCNLTLYQKPIDFAYENANVTKRLENLIVRYASFLSYSQVEQRIKSSVTKQAVGQIVKRWVEQKDIERGDLFYTPRVLGLFSFLWDDQKRVKKHIRGYVLVVDACDRDIHIIDVLKEISTDEITVLLAHMEKNKIEYVVTDCNDIIVSAVIDQLPNAEVLVNTDILFDSAVDGFKEIIKKDAAHTMNVDKRRLLTNPSNLSNFDAICIKNVTDAKPRVNNGYDHLNLLRSILARKWDITDIREWENQIPIDCADEFGLTSLYIDTYWGELLNFYKRRREVTPELYEKLKKLDLKLRSFKLCSDEVFRAKVLYLSKIGEEIKESRGQWRGVPYADVLNMLDTLLNEMED